MCICVITEWSTMRALYTRFLFSSRFRIILRGRRVGKWKKIYFHIVSFLTMYEYEYYGLITLCFYMTLSESVPVFFDPSDCSLLDFFAQGILQARILEWVAISSSRRSSWPRGQTHISTVSCIAGGFLTSEPLGKPVW